MKLKDEEKFVLDEGSQITQQEVFALPGIFRWPEPHDSKAAMELRSVSAVPGRIKALFEDFLEFFLAVIKDWAGYTTGGIVVALLGLWSVIARIPPSRQVGIGLAFFFLFVACFNAWRKQLVRRAELGRDKRRQNGKTATILFVSKFISDGQSLLLINPDDTATPQEIDEWLAKARAWKDEVSNYLWAIARTKFDDLIHVESEDFYGAHKSIWPMLNILKKHLLNLNEILKNPDIYLVGMW